MSSPALVPAATAPTVPLMHVSVDRDADALMTEITAAARVADHRTTTPILSHLLLGALSQLATRPSYRTFRACGFGLLKALADAASSLVSFRFVRTG